jgi:hypothetical protein
MGPVALPAVGAQTRRKSDGLLGEIYATDPPHNLLSVRWPTVPGTFAHEDCTPDQFARVWELTGAKLTPPRETKVALGLICFLVLTLFGFVLAHNSGSIYMGYDPFRPAASESPNVLNNASALHDRYALLAANACAGGADEYIRSITEHRFHWVNSDVLKPRFDQFNPKVIAPGVLTLITEKPEVSNGFGVFKPITVYCNYDTQSREVLGYTTENPAD